MVGVTAGQFAVAGDDFGQLIVMFMPQVADDVVGNHAAQTVADDDDAVVVAFVMQGAQQCHAVGADLFAHDHVLRVGAEVAGRIAQVGQRGITQPQADGAEQQRHQCEGIVAVVEPAPGRGEGATGNQQQEYHHRPARGTPDRHDGLGNVTARALENIPQPTQQVADLGALHLVGPVILVEIGAGAAGGLQDAQVKIARKPVRLAPVERRAIGRVRRDHRFDEAAQGVHRALFADAVNNDNCLFHKLIFLESYG